MPFKQGVSSWKNWDDVLGVQGSYLVSMSALAIYRSSRKR